MTGPNPAAVGHVIPGRRRRWLKSRARRVFASGVAVLVVLVVVVTARLFVWPTTDGVGNPDAVVLFVGGRGERLETALRVAAAHDIANLVIPNGNVSTWPEANELCGEPQQELRVWCPVPRPDTTRGEARVIADLAREQGWSQLTMVTSDYHLTRARVMLSRCFDGEINALTADSELGLIDRGIRIAHEWVGFIRARVLDRSC